MQVATFAIKPGDACEREFPLSLFAGGRYALEVHAPNGFYRSFAASKETQAIRAAIDYEKNGSSLAGNVRVTVENASERALLISVEDESYGATIITRDLGAGQRTSIVLDLTGSHRWYDFSLKANNGESIGRFAGRVETGTPSFSDPLMGGASSKAEASPLSAEA